MNVYSPTGIRETVVKCALLCVCCNLPAGRKVCGFLSYSAKLGCSRCLKEFSGSVKEQRDYSGFDHAQWPPKNVDDHRKLVDELKKCRTKTELSNAESEYGGTYSCLLDLPYFNPTRFLTYDPMHNLFLGTGKHMLSIWIDNNILNKVHFDEIQTLVDTTLVLSDIGWIPSKIGSGFSGFKDDQFKT